MEQKYRPLTAEEKVIYEKQVQNAERNLEYLNYRVDYYELMLTRGLHVEYLKQVRDSKKTQSELKGSILEFANSLKYCKEFLSKGAPIIETPEVKSMEVSDEVKKSE